MQDRMYIAIKKIEYNKDGVTIKKIHYGIDGYWGCGHRHDGVTSPRSYVRKMCSSCIEA